MRQAWADLGARPLAETCWRLSERNLVYLNADQLALAARSLHGAAWLGAAPQTGKPGLLGRLQAQGTIARVGRPARLFSATTSISSWLIRSPIARESATMRYFIRGLCASN